MQKIRILLDLYHTDLSPQVIEHMITHISHIFSRVYKIAFSAEPYELRKLKKRRQKVRPVPFGCCMFDKDQDTDKTWIVSDSF